MLLLALAQVRSSRLRDVFHFRPGLAHAGGDGGYRSQVNAHSSLIRLTEHHERPAGTLRQTLHVFELSMTARDRILEIMSLNDVG